jgi:SAM-dependent methyltransferase
MKLAIYNKDKRLGVIEEKEEKIVYLEGEEEVKELFKMIRPPKMSDKALFDSLPLRLRSYLHVVILEEFPNSIAQDSNLSAIEIANVTDRSTSGALAGNAIVPRTARKLAKKTNRLLDFGAGKTAIYTKRLRKAGYNVTAYDFGDNFDPNIHDRNALVRQYDIVFASNVLNVQSTRAALAKTIKQIKSTLKSNGIAIANYPASPRKLEHIDGEAMQKILHNYFQSVEIIEGGMSSPVFELRLAASRNDANEEGAVLPLADETRVSVEDTNDIITRISISKGNRIVSDWLDRVAGWIEGKQNYQEILDNSEKLYDLLKGDRLAELVEQTNTIAHLAGRAEVPVDK